MLLVVLSVVSYTILSWRASSLRHRCTYFLCTATNDSIHSPSFSISSPVALLVITGPLQVELNSQNHTGATPFFAACTGVHAKVVKYLAGKRRGDDFAVDIEVGRMPHNMPRFLMYPSCPYSFAPCRVAKYYHTFVVQCVLDSTLACLSVLTSHLFVSLTQLPDDNGVTPYGIAVAMGHKDVVHEIDFARQVRQIAELL